MATPGTACVPTPSGMPRTICRNCAGASRASASGMPVTRPAMPKTGPLACASSPAASAGSAANSWLSRRRLGCSGTSSRSSRATMRGCAGRASVWVNSVCRSSACAAIAFPALPCPALLAGLQLGEGRGHGRLLRRLGRAALAALMALAAPACALEAVVTGAIAARGRRIQLHGQADALARHIDLQHLDLDDLAGLDDLARVLDELVAHLADVDQAVLVHAQVHEGAELGHVADRALQRHAFLEVLDVFHAVIEAGDDEVRARVAAGLFQLAQDVLDGDGTELLAHELLGLQALEHLGAAHELVHALARGGNDAFDHGIGFRVHARHVQRVVPAADAQKACGLLEGLGAQAGHLDRKSVV